MEKEVKGFGMISRLLTHQASGFKQKGRMKSTPSTASVRGSRKAGNAP